MSTKHDEFMARAKELLAQTPVEELAYQQEKLMHEYLEESLDPEVKAVVLNFAQRFFNEEAREFLEKVSRLGAIYPAGRTIDSRTEISRDAAGKPCGTLQLRARRGHH